MASTEKIRVGLVGVGSWGRYGHIPALRLLPGYEIVAVASRRQETAAEIASQFGIRHAFADFRLLAENPDVDLMVVLPPAPEHAHIVKAAIATGKDVYCEWPLSTDTSDSEELLHFADEARVRHFVGLQRTVGASSLLFKDLVTSRYAGNLRSVRMHVSMGGFGLVMTAVYWTTKAAIHSYALSLRFKLRHTPVRVLEIIPAWVRTELLNSGEEPRAMPLDEFLTGTMEVLNTDANEIMVPRAKFLREQAGPAEEQFVSSFNEQLEAPQT